jgi:signal transduction histidine kinase
MSATVAADFAKALGVRGWPRLPALYAVTCPLAAVLIVAAFWPMWRDRPLLALGNVVLSMALLCAGILLLDEPSQQSSAKMLLGSSALLTAGWLNNWHVGPLPLISVPTSPAGTILAAWAMYSYPSSPYEKRAGNRFFVVMLACILAGDALYIVTSRPRWSGFPANAWWPALYPDRMLSETAERVLDVVGIGFAVAYVVLWAARWRRSRGISRRLARPVAVAASVVCAAVIVELAATAMLASSHVMNLIYTVEAYLQISVPAAFAVAVLQRRFARTRIADLVLRLRGPARASSLTDALRNVLEDPGLEVMDCAAATASSARQENGSDRLRLPVVGSSGDELAVILADPALSHDDDLVRAAVAASSFALENAQLESALTEQLREVRDSRLRIVQVSIAERRRLERDLHDGTQQRLLALKMMLAAAETDATDEASRALIGRVRSELAQVIEELRDLAHGIHPAALGQVGLEQAIRSMAERYPIPIQVSLPPGRFGEAAELTGYYIIAESVTNAIKHGQASRITIQGEKSGGWLRITVSDDGQGGASPAAGTGIRGIIDRARAIGGDAELDSVPGRGTRITARVPCE